MKNFVILIAVGFFCSVNYAQDICTNSDGSLQYKSATNLGDFTYITSPMLKLAGNELAFIDGSCDGLCHALGYGKKTACSGDYKNGTDKEPYPLVVYLDQNGKATEIKQVVGTQNNRSFITNVSCLNK